MELLLTVHESESSIMESLELNGHLDEESRIRRNDGRFTA